MRDKETSHFWVGQVPEPIAGEYFVESYAEDPAPATFRVITNPLVVWLWIGALIALAGAAFAIWPTAEGRRRLRSAYEARLGRELKRA